MDVGGVCSGLKARNHGDQRYRAMGAKVPDP
jgi:hypothetical protein